jgi:hypothetical protein
VQRIVASLGVSAIVASCSLALFWSWDVFSEPRLARAQTTGTCPNAQLIDTYEGTGDQQTDTFTTTTDSFRVSLTSGPGLTYVDVINADRPNDLPVASLSQDGRGQAETFANTPPGTYYLDIISGADYTITVEQCEGGDPSRNPGGRNPGGGAPPVRDQYGADKRVGPIDRPAGVIPRTAVRRVPRTGGPPYLAVGAVVLLGVALIAGRGVLRR